DVPTGPLTIAPVHPGDGVTITGAGADRRLTGAVTRVPWGRAAQHVVVVADGVVALVAGQSAAIEHDVNLALEPRDTLRWERAPVIAAARADRLPADVVRLYGALVRSAQMAGGLECLLEQTVRYVGERKQFGRPIGSFQAIQHQLALLAGHTAAAGIASATAF